MTEIKQVSCLGGVRAAWIGGTRTLSWLGEMVYIFSGELVTWRYLFIEIHRIVHLRLELAALYRLCLSFQN